MGHDAGGRISMWHEAWGWEGHVDARRSLRRRAAFNGSTVRFRLVVCVVCVVSDLFASFCIYFPFVCFNGMLVVLS